MRHQSKVRKVLGRACSLIAVGTAAVALTSPAATAAPTGGTYEFGYENGFEGWAPKTDETAGAPDCDGLHNSAVLRSADKPRTGKSSVDFKLRSPHDCGLAYVDRRFTAGTTAPVRIELSFWLWSTDDEIGSGGTFAVLAHSGADCIADPRLDPAGEAGGGWIDFTELGSTGHSEGPGWYNYRYQATVTPNSRGQVCVSQGIKLSSTTGDDYKHYYIDDTKVTIS